MKSLALCVSLLLSALAVAWAPPVIACASFLDVEVRRLHSSETVNLCDIAGNRPVVIVNTASNCGFTPQFRELERLHREYSDRGVVFIGFPSNDFFQEEDEEKKTADVCYVNYGVTFTMTRHVAVRGEDAHPVFRALAAQAGAPKWNFYKYLVDREGRVQAAFSSMVRPDSAEFRNALVRLAQSD